jgi:hypothetical protein
MSIAELTGSNINHGNTWVAVAEVTVVDSQDDPVAGVEVSGKWDEGDIENPTCTTDKTGKCELESGSIRKRVSQTIFEIIGLEHDVLSYDPDLDAVDSLESQPSDITIRKP